MIKHQFYLLKKNLLKPSAVQMMTICLALWPHIRSYCWFSEWITIRQLGKGFPQITSQEFRIYCSETMRIIIERRGLNFSLFINHVKNSHGVISGTVFIELFFGDAGYMEIFKVKKKASISLTNYLIKHCKSVNSHISTNTIRYYEQNKTIYRANFQTCNNTMIYHSHVDRAFLYPRECIETFPIKCFQNWFDGERFLFW